MTVPRDIPEGATVTVLLTVGAADLEPLAAAIAVLLPPAATSDGWPEWMNVETAARYIDCTPRRADTLRLIRNVRAGSSWYPQPSAGNGDEPDYPEGAA